MAHGASPCCSLCISYTKQALRAAIAIEQRALFAVSSCGLQYLSGAEARNMVLAQAYNAEKAGAKAIIVADYKDERLLTMAVPEDRPEIAALKNDITIPTALITQVCHDTHC